MPDEAQAVSAEGAPQGRGDPGGGLSTRLGPLPLWGWAVATLAVFGVVWYMHGKSGVSTSVVGHNASGGAPPGDTSNVGPTPDPNGNTLSALLAAMKDMATQLSTFEKKNSTASAVYANNAGNTEGLNLGYVPNANTNPDVQFLPDSYAGADIAGFSNGHPYRLKTLGGLTDPSTWGKPTGGAIGGPRPPRVHALKRKHKKLPWMLGILEESLAGIDAFSTSHTLTNSPAAASVSTAPTQPTPSPYTGVFGGITVDYSQLGRPPVSQGGAPAGSLGWAPLPPGVATPPGFS